ncbi:MAG: nuclear transport factor 2 family protein [Candidatus Binatia bacterium]
MVAAYAHAADSGRFDGVAALFTPTACWRLPIGPNTAAGQGIQTFLGGTGGELGGGGDRAADPASRQQPQLTVTDPDDAGTAYFLVVTESGPDHWGRYRDRYVRGGEWCFAHRRGIRLDGWAPGGWAARRRGA